MPEHDNGDARAARHEIGKAGVAFQIDKQYGAITVQAARPSGPTRVPHEYGRYGGVFVNHRPALSTLDGRLSDDDPGGLVVIRGQSGVGKRTLVRRWVPKVRERFPGGQMHIDLAAAGGTVLTALQQCFQYSLGVAPEWIGTTLAACTRQLQTWTSEDAVLMVVENAQAPAQVRALLPNAPGSLVLVIGGGPDMEELAMDGATFLNLKPLGPADARELMTKVCGAPVLAADPAATDALIAACDGLPVALQVAAARIVRENIGVGELVAELSDERHRLAGLSLGGRPLVDTLFTTAYQGLPPDARLAYRRCALLPGPDFGAEVAAVVTGLPPERCGDALAHVEAAGLVQRERGTYRMLDLVRLHGTDRADADEDPTAREESLRRVVWHYLAQAANAALAAMPERRYWSRFPRTPPDRYVGEHARHRAVDWLAGHHGHLLATQKVAAEYGWDVPAAQLGEALTALYLHRRYLAEWVRSGRTGADAAGRAGLPALEARLRSLTSRPLDDLGYAEEAGRFLESARSLVEPLDDPVLRASVYEFSGRHLDGDPAGAVPWYQRSLACNAEAGERRGVALVELFLGDALWRLGERDEAMERIRHAEQELRALGDARMTGRALRSLGGKLAELGQRNAAIESLTTALVLLNRAPYYQAQAHEDLARLLHVTDTEQARGHLRAALEIHESTGSPEAGRLRAALDGTTDTGAPGAGAPD